MSASPLKLTKPAAMNVKFAMGRHACTAVFAAALAFAGVTQAACADETYKLTLKDHKFTPSELTIPANERFIIEVENQDATPAEFESFDMKVEKFVVGGGKITLRMRALKAGAYKFFDDYNPDLATGTITVVEAKPKE